MKVLILDGYTDEPSRLGVPPYIAPGPRYLFGAVISSGNEGGFTTVDEFRQRVKGREGAGDFYRGSNMLITILGAVVPGTYLTTRPMSQKEALLAARTFEGERILVIPQGTKSMGNMKPLVDAYDRVISGNAPEYIFELLNSGRARERTGVEVNEDFALYGAEGVGKMAAVPIEHAICEIDTYYGCHRYKSGGCSFCIEPVYGKPIYRDADAIIKEIKTLHDHGIEHFRIGGQSCILSYRLRNGEVNVGAIKDLFEGIRHHCPKIRTLHVDNVDPGIAVTNGGKKGLEVIARHTTPGNVLAFGLESADPAVIEKNNLNTNPEECMDAIRIVNSIGRQCGANGMPHMLPGINIVLGLKGETRATLKCNLSFLRGIRREGLWTRRINIRNVVGVRDGFEGGKKWRGYDHDIYAFKKGVRDEIDRPLLIEMFPQGHILRDVVAFAHKGTYTYCKQIGSYPVVVILPYNVPLYRALDATVISHRERSLVCIEMPFDVNTMPISALKQLPYIGKRRAVAIARYRPFNSWEEVRGAVGLDDDIIQALKKLGVAIKTGKIS